MKFEIGDEIHKAVVNVIVHEYIRCRMSFNLFLRTSPRTAEEMGNQSIDVNLLRYNAYAMFVQHLYEFMIACIKLENKDTSEINWRKSDPIINREVEKLLEMKRNAIDFGFASQGENARSAYEMPCPEYFARDLSQMRNSIGHADYRRIIGERRITLTDFYKKYHIFIYLIYDNAKDLWLEQDKINLDLGDVTKFNILIWKE